MICVVWKVGSETLVLEMCSSTIIVLMSISLHLIHIHTHYIYIYIYTHYDIKHEIVEHEG